MPELPEVETVRRALEPVLVGRRLDRVRIGDPRLTRPAAPGDVARRLEGERVASVARRGKYLVIGLESGRHLLVHLRMTGSFRCRASGRRLAADPYRRAVARLDDGSDVAYRDVRRFGTWLLVDTPEEAAGYLDERLGPEPLGSAFGPAALQRAAAGRRVPIKVLLLDQRTVAGVGNIYADESLWRARIHPAKPAGALDAAELKRLARAVKDALRRGIERQGASLGDASGNFAGPDGAYGSMQNEFAVYGRAGDPCPRCGAFVERIVLSGRSSHYCPRCQARCLAP